jgi:hypothetical protein
MIQTPGTWGKHPGIHWAEDWMRPKASIGKALAKRNAVNKERIEPQTLIIMWIIRLLLNIETRERKKFVWTLVGKPDGKRPLARRSVHVRIILKRILKKEDEDVDWIPLAKVVHHWRALVNTVMNLRTP